MKIFDMYDMMMIDILDAFGCSAGSNSPKKFLFVDTHVKHSEIKEIDWFE